MEVQIPQKVQVRGKCYPCDGFASVKLFSVNYLGLHLVRKCETQQTCKHCESTSPMAEIHSSHNPEFIIIQSLSFHHVCETAWKKIHFKEHLGSMENSFMVTGISDKISDWLNSFSALGGHNHSITLKCTWNYRIIIIIIIIIVVAVVVIIIILVTCTCSGLFFCFC